MDGWGCTEEADESFSFLEEVSEGSGCGCPLNISKIGRVRRARYGERKRHSGQFNGRERTVY